MSGGLDYDYLAELTEEVRRLRSDIARTREEVAELGRRLAERPAQATDVEVLSSLLREAVERINAVASAMLEGIAALRTALEENRGALGELCTAIGERLAALQELLAKRILSAE
jgi:triphosphoribosyl-dephospho-CoA synthetase